MHRILIFLFLESYNFCSLGQTSYCFLKEECEALIGGDTEHFLAPRVRIMAMTASLNSPCLGRKSLTDIFERACAITAKDPQAFASFSKPKSECLQFLH